MTMMIKYDYIAISDSWEYTIYGKKNNSVAL